MSLDSSCKMDDVNGEITAAQNLDLPIFFLSGMAADERLFADQLAAFPNLRVLPWIEPLPSESLSSYAKRISLQLDPGQPCIVGGASFGGTVAMEMAQHVRAVACILIGSIRSPDELPRSWRRFRPLAAFGPTMIRGVASFGTRYAKCFLSKSQLRRLRRLSVPLPESAFLRWAICALMNWKPTKSNSIPIYQIHGSADEVFPAGLTRPDIVVSGGVHALTIFSPTEVNRFIADVVVACQRRELSSGGLDECD
jgi:pimeloyl-ACP methyl ester carboxylesterase